MAPKCGEEHETFGAWLRRELKVRGWSLRELSRRMAKASGPDGATASQPAISRWMKETEPTKPTDENIAVLAEVLGYEEAAVHEALGRVDRNSQWSEQVTRLADQIESLHPGDRQAVEALIRALAERQPETR